MNADLESMNKLHGDIAKSYDVQLAEMNGKLSKNMDNSNIAYQKMITAYSGEMVAINDAMMDKLDKFQESHTKIVSNYEKSLSDMMAKVNKSIEEDSKLKVGGAYGKMKSSQEEDMLAMAKAAEAKMKEADMLHKIIEMIDLQSMSNRIGGSGLSTPKIGGDIGNTLDQKVEIAASFPGVKDRHEIEEAFKNLVNQASQYAGRSSGGGKSGKSSKKK